jgi:hypothetical protein
VQSSFEKLVQAFTVIAYAGIGFVVAGAIVGAFFQGATRVCVIGFALGGGGLMSLVGFRERRRGKKILIQLHERATKTES